MAILKDLKGFYIDKVVVSPRAKVPIAAKRPERYWHLHRRHTSILYYVVAEYKNPLTGEVKIAEFFVWVIFPISVVWYKRQRRRILPRVIEMIELERDCKVRLIQEVRILAGDRTLATLEDAIPRMRREPREAIKDIT